MLYRLSSLKAITLLICLLTATIIHKPAAAELYGATTSPIAGQQSNSQGASASRPSSDGAMFCVTPQRTNAYNTPALSAAPSKVVWTSDRLFGRQTLIDFTLVGGSMGGGDSTAGLSRDTFPVLAGGVIYLKEGGRFCSRRGNGTAEMASQDRRPLLDARACRRDALCRMSEQRNLRIGCGDR